MDAKEYQAAVSDLIEIEVDSAGFRELAMKHGRQMRTVELFLMPPTIYGPVKMGKFLVSLT